MKFKITDLRPTILYRMGELQLTTEQLAERANVTPECIRNMTSGKVKRPRLDVFLRLMNALELDVWVEGRIT